MQKEKLAAGMVRLPVRTYAALRKLAIDRQTTFPRLARLALEQFLHSEAKQDRSSNEKR